MTLLGVFGLPVSIGFGLWYFWHNPEGPLRATRQEWIYVLFRTRLGQLKQLIVPVRKIKNGTVELYGGLYNIRDKDKKGHSSVVSWKHKRPAYLFDWNDPNPQSWVPNHSLNTDTDPKDIKAVQNNRLLQQMMLADFYQKIIYVAFALSIVSVLLSAAVAFNLFNLQKTLESFIAGFGSATSTNPNPGNGTAVVR